MAPELELLLACCAHAADPPALEELDFGLVESLALRHGVHPALTAALERWQIPVPQDARERIRRRATTIQVRNRALINLLHDVLRTLEERGISAVPFKGPAFAEQYLADPLARPYSDLDLLISSGSLSQARQALQAAGFRDEMPLGPELEMIYRRTECEWNMARGGRVELHWGFVPRAYSVDFDFQSVAPRLESQKLLGRDVLALSPEDTLVAIALHGAKHRWSRLGYIYDVSAVLRSPHLSPERALDIAKRSGLHRIVVIGTALAHTLLNVPLPDEIVRAQTADTVGMQLAKQYGSAIRSGNVISLSTFGEVRQFWRMRERASDRVRSIYRFAVAPTVTDASFLRLPRALEWLYPGVRLARRLSGRRQAVRQPE